MFRSHKGISPAVEWLIGGALVIALLFTIIKTVATTTQGKGTGLNAWISGQTVPAP